MQLFSDDEYRIETGPTEEEIQQVFDYWVATCRTRAGAVVLDDKRRRAIRRALELYPMTTLRSGVVPGTELIVRQSERPMR